MTLTSESSRSLRSLELLCSLFVAYRTFLLSIHMMPETGRILAAAILHSDSVNFLKESVTFVFGAPQMPARLHPGRRASQGPSESLIIQSSLQGPSLSDEHQCAF